MAVLKGPMAKMKLIHYVKYNKSNLKFLILERLNDEVHVLTTRIESQIRFLNAVGSHRMCTDLLLLRRKPLMCALYFHSDRFQEYKKKHQELKAAVQRELANEAANKLFAAKTVSEGEKGADEETGCGKEVENGGSSSVENTMESQLDQPVEETCVDTIVSVNGEKTEVDGDDSECSEGADSGAEARLENGEKGSMADTESSTPNGVEGSTADEEMKSDATAEEMKSGTDEVNGVMNGDLEITGSPSALKSKGTLADVVSKDVTVNGTGEKNEAVNAE